MLMLSLAATSAASFVTVSMMIENADPPAVDPFSVVPSPPATTSLVTGEVMRTTGPSDSITRPLPSPGAVTGLL